LSAAAARQVWIWSSVLCLALALWLTVTELSWSREPWALAGIVALFTLPAPVREQLLLGQMYVPLLLLHTIGWRAYAHRRDATAGIVLALAMMLKISGWPIGVLMLAQRRWVAVGSALLTSLACLVISIPWVGVDAWRTLISVVIPHTLTWPAATLTAYQDTTGFWQHWLRYDAQLNPHPLIDAPVLASVLTLLSTVTALLVLIRWCAIAAAQQHQFAERIAFAAAVALSVLLSPAAEQHQYVLMLLPLTMLWHEAHAMRRPVVTACAVMATFLLAWPIHYKAPHPAWDLLESYPRLLGGWLVFGVLLAASPGRRRTGMPVTAEERTDTTSQATFVATP
jgi:hypothetical protein